MTRFARSICWLAVAGAVWFVQGWPVTVPVFAARANCTVSTTPVAFGTYTPSAPAPLDAAGTVSWRCTGNQRTVRVMIGAGGRGSFARAMTGPLGVVLYNLFLEATRQTIWGDGTAGTQFLSQDTRSNETYTATVYGRIPAGQNVEAGLYSDSLVITVLE
jgi:spore coat protein U-like protein